MESASNTDMTNWRDNVHRVYNGKMLVYIQTSGSAGNVEATFTAPWLESAKVSLSVD
jgi:hypothetical protein